MVSEQVNQKPKSRARRMWLMAVPVLGALAVGGLAIASPARAEGLDGGDEAGPGQGFMARRMERMLDKVNATPGQRSQIQNIWAGLRPQLRALHLQHAQVRKQMMAALTGTTINAADVEKLRQQSMGIADKTSALMTQGLVATAGVLTPDQRKLAQQEFEQHRGRHFGPHAP